MVFTGRFRFGIDRWESVPFEVPAGVHRITVSVTHSRFAIGLAGNVLDLGIFGPAGADPGNETGFRGWSGGARTWFTLSESDATPGYLPGPIDAGTWTVALGPVVLNAALGGSDSHAPHQGVGLPQTVVRARELSLMAIVEGLLAGRAYVVESTAVTLDLAASCLAGTASPGEDLAVPADAPVTVCATVTGAPGCTLTIHTAAGVVAASTVDGSGTRHLRWTTTGWGGSLRVR